MGPVSVEVAPLACLEAAPEARHAPEWVPGTPPGTWPSASLPVAFTFAAPLPRALGVANDAIAELAVAARTWSEVACTSFRATVPSLDARPGLTPGDDSVNGVFFHEDTWPAELIPKALGQTIVTLDAQGRIHDADIHLNGVDYRWSLGQSPGDGTVDLRGVLLHELGHALGLGHSSDPRATMYASHPPGLVWRSLEKDDRDGVCALYTGTGGPRCDSGDACPAGLVCVAGGCERKGARGVVCAPCARVAGACDGAGDDARCNDLPTGGRVCGRACATDTDPCTGDADCAPDATCKNAACVGPGDVSVSPDAGAADGSLPGTAGPTAAGGGCTQAPHTPSRSGAFWLSLLALAGAYVVRKMRSPRRASPASSRRARRASGPTSS